MKKFISIASAAAVAITSLSAFAAPYFTDYAKEDRNLTNVPAEDTVEVKLDMQSHDASRTAVYTNHASQATALSTTSTSMVFNTQASLDMSNVAKEWEAYLDAAVNSGIERSSAIDRVKLAGEFTVEATACDSAISNESISAGTPAGWTWDEMTTKLFRQKSASYDAATNKLTIVMEVSGSNKDFDTYFTSLNDGTASSNTLTVTVPNTTVQAQSSLTTSGEYHDITGSITGAVTVSLADKQISKINFSGNDKEYYKLYRRSSSGGGGGGGATRPTATPVATQTAEPTEAPTSEPVVTATPIPEDKIQTKPLPSGAQLDYSDHYAYVVGYPESEGVDENGYVAVRPNANITRAEVATIFVRLLTQESRDKLFSTTNDFPDVPADSWYNNAISTAANAGLVNGYDTGNFGPDDAITRAEFATIAARFSSVEYTGEDKFPDIKGHWAADSINKAVETGWINGYDNGTFRPDNSITRAEAMTLINRILYRIVDKNNLDTEHMTKFSDNLDTDAWYYADVQEATNSHSYERERIGAVEKWTGIIASPDWNNI